MAGDRFPAAGGRFLLDAGFGGLAGGGLLLDAGLCGLAGGRFLAAGGRFPAVGDRFPAVGDRFLLCARLRLPALFVGLLPSVFGFRQVSQVLSRLRIVEPQPPAGHPQLRSQHFAPRRKSTADATPL